MIVGKFHGEIDFTSTYKQGSTFFFTFEHVQYSEEELDMVPLNPQKQIIDETKAKIDVAQLDRDLIHSRKISCHL